MKLLPENVKNKKQFNLAGIIPVAGQPLDFNFPWHDCLVPRLLGVEYNHRGTIFMVRWDQDI